MESFTIYAPGVWCDDIYPAMEDWEMYVDLGQVSVDGVVVVNQYHDGDRTVRRGKGTAHRFDLTTPAQVTWLAQEADYRVDLNSSMLNDYPEPEDRAYIYKARRAARTLLQRCEETLAAMVAASSSRDELEAAAYHRSRVREMLRTQRVEPLPERPEFDVPRM